MGAREDIDRLVKEAAASIKGDVRGAIAKLDAAYALAKGDAEASSRVAEELARAWSRAGRKGGSASKALLFAARAAKLTPERKAAWNTLAKTCELVASRIQDERKQVRARALYRAAAGAFKKAASMTKDPEDKRWLLELAGDAARQARPPEA